MSSQNINHFSLALVTGASSGIGTALCHLLADKGINLIIHGRDKVRLDEVANALHSKVSVTTVHADMADRVERQKLIDIIHMQKPDLVINNAGYGLYGNALSHETDTSLELLEVDGAGVLELSLEAARTLITADKKGVILNVASAAAFPIFPYFAVYSAVKAFVVQFSESFDEEMKPYGIRVLVSCPGVVATGFRGRAGGNAEAPSNVMTVEFAAKDIWDQIQRGQKTRIFNWRYRFSIFMTKYILPKQLVAKLTKKGIEKRHDFKPIIKLNEKT